MSQTRGGTDDRLWSSVTQAAHEVHCGFVGVRRTTRLHGQAASQAASLPLSDLPHALAVPIERNQSIFADLQNAPELRGFDRRRSAAPLQDFTLRGDGQVVPQNGSES